MPVILRLRFTPFTIDYAVSIRPVCRGGVHPARPSHTPDDTWRADPEQLSNRSGTNISGEILRVAPILSAAKNLSSLVHRQYEITLAARQARLAFFCYVCYLFDYPQSCRVLRQSSGRTANQWILVCDPFVVSPSTQLRTGLSNHEGVLISFQTE